MAPGASALGRHPVHSACSAHSLPVCVAAETWRGVACGTRALHVVEGWGHARAREGLELQGAGLCPPPGGCLLPPAAWLPSDHSPVPTDTQAMASGSPRLLVIVLKQAGGGVLAAWGGGEEETQTLLPVSCRG